MNQFKLSKKEYRSRTDDLLNWATANGHDGIILFDPINIQYITGLYHLPRERPLVVGITTDTVHAVVPRLEADNARDSDNIVDKAHVYFDYPQGDPMNRVAEMCDQLGITSGQIVSDRPGNPEIMGYQGPDLETVISGTVETTDRITKMRRVKSDAEIELVRTASVWANLGLEILRETIEYGHLPVELSARAEAEASRRMLDTVGNKYEMIGRERIRPIECSFTTSTASERPHEVNQLDRVSPGDSLVSIVVPRVGGYRSELERTMIVGEPSDDQRHYFQIAKEAQLIGINKIAAGVEYAVVADAVAEYFDEQGVTDHTQHHVGHNLALEKHEQPYLDRGSEGKLEKNELFTIEPGLYVPDVGGFRHSDTVRVTENGVEELTYYPRDLPELIINHSGE